MHPTTYARLRDFKLGLRKIESTLHGSAQPAAASSEGAKEPPRTRTIGSQPITNAALNAAMRGGAAKASAAAAAPAKERAPSMPSPAIVLPPAAAQPTPQPTQQPTQPTPVRHGPADEHQAFIAEINRLTADLASLSRRFDGMQASLDSVQRRLDELERNDRGIPVSAPDFHQTFVSAFVQTQAHSTGLAHGVSTTAIPLDQLTDAEFRPPAIPVSAAAVLRPTEGHAAQAEGVQAPAEDQAAQAEEVQRPAEVHAAQADEVQHPAEIHAAQAEEVQHPAEVHAAQADAVQHPAEVYAAQADEEQHPAEIHAAQADAVQHPAEIHAAQADEEQHPAEIHAAQAAQADEEQTPAEVQAAQAAQADEEQTLAEVHAAQAGSPEGLQTPADVHAAQAGSPEGLQPPAEVHAAQAGSPEGLQHPAEVQAAQADEEQLPPSDPSAPLEILAEDQPAEITVTRDASRMLMLIPKEVANRLGVEEKMCSEQELREHVVRFGRQNLNKSSVPFLRALCLCADRVYVSPKTRTVDALMEWAESGVAMEIDAAHD
jgi:hypothetical protein